VTRAALTAAALAALALPGGAHGRAPVPVESLAGFVVRYEAAVGAVQRGDCRALVRLNRDGGLGLRCTDAQRLGFTDFRVLGHRRFGSGAVVDFSALDPRSGTRLTHSLILALGPDRRFRSQGSVLLGRGSGIPQAGTVAAPRVRSLAARTANLALRAVRTRDCGLLYATVNTAGLPRLAACARAFSAANPLRRDLDRDPGAVPVALGGTRDIQFLSLEPRGGRRWTVFVSRSGPPGRLYLAGWRDAAASGR
jgi:hypothetical protein